MTRSDKYYRIKAMEFYKDTRPLPVGKLIVAKKSPTRPFSSTSFASPGPAVDRQHSQPFRAILDYFQTRCREIQASPVLTQ